ncbi:putative membrane protein [Actinoalloteichus hoggarensis]|uniref:Uncharacterized protein n=1 Tax=Actinoalloteichus hoggarensis TaxID=1470176 RepID=A0A221W1T9_9PSEU|nr:DUF1772 domain-containing protein [Actinoalloteichus hoggarensis]ASO19716.1 hypothetical protein AHOG_10365 [Actinoalloteichus hoggarensis]MBB5919577.1 putative membrane protein [Actinoalloteichus hoggarensis]
MLQVLLPLVLLANGLSAGVLVGTQLGGWPLLAALPPGRYVHAHAFFSTRYDPFMPICLVLTVLIDGVLLVVAPTPVLRLLCALAALLALGTVLISLIKNVPVNKWIQRLDPENLPADFDRVDPRRTWGGWNRTRSTLAVSALLVNCLVAGLLL